MVQKIGIYSSIKFLQLSLNLVSLNKTKPRFLCYFNNIMWGGGPRKGEGLVTTHIQFVSGCFDSEPPRKTNATDPNFKITLHKCQKQSDQHPTPIALGSNETPPWETTPARHPFTKKSIENMFRIRTGGWEMTRHRCRIDPPGFR